MCPRKEVPIGISRVRVRRSLHSSGNLEVTESRKPTVGSVLTEDDLK